MPTKQKHECHPGSRCRVKDIAEQHKVHLPLSVFQELNIASCWMDWVDKYDIERALVYIQHKPALQQDIDSV